MGLGLVADHAAGLGDIPAGAKTYRLYADFCGAPRELRMMGLWGDEHAPWFIEAPEVVAATCLGVFEADEDALSRSQRADQPAVPQRSS